MAGKKTPMSKIIEIQRLMNLAMTDRAIARALKVSRNTVAAVREALTAELKQKPAIEALGARRWFAVVDWEKVKSEHAKNITLYVLWEELRDSGTIKIQYPAFWKQFNHRFPKLKQSMHRVFSPASRTEIDYCDGIDFFDLISGDVISTQLFVGVLCHSRYVYAEFTLTQKSQDFLASHVRMFEFFGGVTEVVSPDNLKSAVTKAHRYDPEINPAYTRLAEHYQIAVVPARVRTPKDKAIVERSIQIFQRWFYGKMRHKTCASLIELNAYLAEHLVLFNNKKHRIFRRSRAEMFFDEKNHLRALPESNYLVSTYAKASVHPDCHLIFEKNFYSVPHILRGKSVDIWAYDKTIEIYFEGSRVALHGRSRSHGLFITNKNHYPESHRAYAESTPAFVRNIAREIGPETFALVDSLFNCTTPLRYLRRAQGIVRLEKKHGKEALEKASEKANIINNKSYAYVERIIKFGGLKIDSEKNIKLNRGENPYLRGRELFH